MDKKIIKSLLSGLLILGLTLQASAQNGDHDPGPPPVDVDGPGDPDAEVPFDGGISLLLLAGTAYGARKAVEHRKAAQVSRRIH